MPRKRSLKALLGKRDTPAIAERLLGASLVRRWKGEIMIYPITEVEAYDGFTDRASHASRGKTKRNAIMFGKPGHWYVYFTYGMHWMLNIVTGPKDYPAAVLIRGVGDISGPARLTKQLHITGALNGALASRRSGLWIVLNDPPRRKDIVRTARIGVNYAGLVWSKKKYRFVLKTEKSK